MNLTSLICLFERGRWKFALRKGLFPSVEVRIRLHLHQMNCVSKTLSSIESEWEWSLEIISYRMTAVWERSSAKRHFDQSSFTWIGNRDKLTLSTHYRNSLLWFPIVECPISIPQTNGIRAPIMGRDDDFDSIEPTNVWRFSRSRVKSTEADDGNWPRFFDLSHKTKWIKHFWASFELGNSIRFCWIYQLSLVSLEFCLIETLIELIKRNVPNDEIYDNIFNLITLALGLARRGAHQTQWNLPLNCTTISFIHSFTVCWVSNIRQIRIDLWSKLVIICC